MINKKNLYDIFTTATVKANVKPLYMIMDHEFGDYLNPCLINRLQMDKKIKALEKKTKGLLKGEEKLLKTDRKNDKVVDKAKKKMKGKC